MELFQILDCGSSVGACCTDYSLVNILNIARRVFDVIQILVPIILTIAATIQFVQLTINPELKDGFRKILNKLIAAVIIFLLPTLVDVVLSSTSNDLNISSCWTQAKIVSEEIGFGGGNYVSTDSDKNSVWLDPVSFNKISNIGGSKRKQKVSSKQQEIVEYAEQFVGEEYEWAGVWDGELPYTPTDCSGFVTGVFRHFGIYLPRGLNMFGYDTSLYDEVSEDDIQPGDVIMYNGHVGILTGNGNEIIHAKGRAWGVVKDPDYKQCSSHEILGILRIKGVK